MGRVFLLGVSIWVVGTVMIRLVGQYLLRPGEVWLTVLLYAASFVAMGFLVRGICHWLVPERAMWVRAVCFLILPTLILDPLSCAFFASLFPNVDPAAAGVFGGWLLICCGGGVVGVLARP